MIAMPLSAWATATTNAPGGMVAVKLATGERVWHAPPEKTLCGAPGRDCNAAQGAAVTAIPGAVLSGSYDGGLRGSMPTTDRGCGSSTPIASS